MSNDHVAVPHEGRKPDWLCPHDTVLGTFPSGEQEYLYAAAWEWCPDRELSILSTHWAAAPILAGLEPFNAELQGPDAPKDRKPGGKVMLAYGDILDPKGDPEPFDFSAGHLGATIIGYERAAQAGEGCNDPNCIATGPHNFCQPTPAADHAKPGREGVKMELVEGYGASFFRDDDCWHVYTMPGIKPFCVIRGWDRAQIDRVLSVLRSTVAPSTTPDLDVEVAKIEALEARVRELEEALTPSGDTKAAYMGEFKFTIMQAQEDEDGEPIECPVSVPVPWTTIKEIMSAIAARAALEPRP